MIDLEIITRKINEKKYVKEFRSENAKLLRKINETKNIVQSTGNTIINDTISRIDRMCSRKIFGIKIGHTKNYKEAMDSLDCLRTEFNSCLSYLDNFIFNMNTFKGTQTNPNPMADKIIGFERAYIFLLGLVEFHTRYIESYKNHHLLRLVLQSYILISMCTTFSELPMYNRSTGYKYDSFLTEVEDYIMMMDYDAMEEILYEGILTDDVKHIISMAAKTFNEC